MESIRSCYVRLEKIGASDPLKQPKGRSPPKGPLYITKQNVNVTRPCWVVIRRLSDRENAPPLERFDLEKSRKLLKVRSRRSSRKEFQCEHCDKSYAVRGNYELHLRKHRFR